MGRPNPSALRLTGEAVTSMPRPLARSGWVTTNFTANPASTRRSRVGTAKAGVPQKTRFITAALPFAGFHHLADLTLEHVALQRTDVTDVQLPVEVIGFVKQGSRQQLLAGDFERLALEILGAGGDFARTSNLFPKLGDAQASFVRCDPPFDVNDLRIDQHDLGVGVFLEGHVDHSNSLADANLRGSQSDAVGGIHALKHVIGELPEFIIELGDRGRRLLQNRIAVFDDGIDHLEVSQLLAVALVISLQLQHRVTTELPQRKPR